MSLSGRKSILVKLVLIMLLISIISGGIVLGVALNEQRQSLENNLIEENKRLAQVAARSIETGYVEQSWPFRTLSQINDSEDVLFWWIVEPDGTIHLADDHAMCGKIVDFKSFETEEEAVVKDYVYRGEDIKFLVQPLRIGEPGKIWYLCIGISLKSVSAAANRVIITSLCYFFLIIAFACGLTFLFARRFTKPIRNLVEGTKAISKGDFDAKVEIKTGDEIEVLGDAFNKMAERVKSSIGALRQKNEEQKVLLSSIPAFVYFKDRNDNYIAANRAFADMTGTSIDEIAGKTDYDFFPKEEADFYRKCDQEVMESGEPKYNIEETVTGVDGKKMWASTSKTPFFNSDGNVIGMVGITLDITERKRAEEEVEKSRKFLATIIDNIPDTVTIMDPQHRFALVNQAYCNIIGHTKEEVIGKTEYWKKDKEIFQTGKGLDIQERFYTDIEGKHHYVSVKKAPLTDESGKVTHVVTISRDITERKCAEDKIKESLKEKEVLLREIHHRVKNNLQIVSSMLSMQAMKAKDKKVIESLLDSRSRIQTMSLIHAQLYQSENFEQVEMGTTIRKLVSSMLQIYAQDKKNITSVVTAEGIILSISQAIPCGLIINELVSNALKHAFTGMTEGSIEISMRELAGDKIKLTVKDNGIGIPEELDIYKTDTLGLKIVRTLAEEQLKGKMGLIRDKGTEIYVEFKSITNGK